MKLNQLRKQIDTLDDKIVGLLNRRAGFSLAVARVKRRSGKSAYSPDRETQVLRRVARTNKGPLTPQAVQAVYREIMSSSLALGASLKIAYLGPEATFTQLSALKKFGSQVSYMPCNSISDVFLQVEKGNADYGVIPIENSIEGAVTHTLDMLVDSDLKICSQIMLDVAHNLLARCPKGRIRRIYSNPQVFGQCRIWLQENLPLAEKIEVSSTTRAAQIAAKEKYSAAIASQLAAKVYGLKVIAADIEDSPYNITRFLVIGKTDVPATGKDRTSIVFSIKDKVGALHDMLAPFEKYRINLTKIESRPSKRKAWDYYFFVDLEGHRDEPRVKKAFQELESKCKFLKVLGSYPIGE
ncbi:MAG TPA: prephenate dehydratase [Patescibacteria group bacterium]|nr:prephenate dehydratase [Patescibacteria group bacterium]